MTLDRTVHPAVRGSLLFVLGIACLWLIANSTVVAYLSNDAPEQPLAASAPSALLVKAERLLDPAVSRGDQSRPAVPPMPTREARAEASELLLRVLSQEPLNAQAVRLLGQLADLDGRPSHADRVMRVANRLSVRDAGASFWLMRKAIEGQRFGEAIHYADNLLRSRYALVPAITPVIAAAADSKEGLAALVDILGRKPQWRSWFLNMMPHAMVDVRTPLNLYFGLRQTGAPATVEEMVPYIKVLASKKLYEFGYYAWLQILPSQNLALTGPVYDRAFRLDPSGMPFEWSVLTGVGSSAGFTSDDDEPGRRMLEVRLGQGQGRVSFDGVVQTILLVPGTYRLRTRFKGELRGPRGLVWRVRCHDAARRVLVTSPAALGRISEWKDVASEFTVPAEPECRAQELALVIDARSASEQIVNGRMLFQLIEITRADAGLKK